MMFALLTLAAATSASATMITIPGGSQISDSCIFTMDNHALITATSPVLQDMARCRAESRTQKIGEAPYTWGTEQIYAQDVHLQNPTAQWLNFTADWIVPELPEKHSGQVDYHWPGFKSQQPEMGYPVLQPVLQYGQHGQAGWQLQSWFVHGGATTAPAIDVAPGDKITSYMAFDESTATWTVYGENLSSNEKSVLTITKKALGDYVFDWAMIVHETIMAKSEYCDEYPASDGVQYTNVYLDGESLEWTERVQKEDCGQAVEHSEGEVSFAWDHSM